MPEEASVAGPAVATLLYGDAPVYNNRVNTGRMTARFLIGAHIGNRPGIKDDKVRIGTLTNETTVSKTKLLCGEARHPMNRCFQRQQLGVPDVFPQDTGKRAVQTRVRLTRNRRNTIRADHGCGMGQDAPDICLIHPENNRDRTFSFSGNQLGRSLLERLSRQSANVFQGLAFILMLDGR